MNIVILYASLTGHTEYIADQIKIYLSCLGYKAACFDVENINEIPSCDLLLFGCSTYHSGDLNPIAEKFLEKLTKERMSIPSTKVAVFGLGESIYPEFCASTELATEFFESQKCQVIKPDLKIDMLQPQYENQREIESWIDNVLDSY